MSLQTLCETGLGMASPTCYTIHEGNTFVLVATRDFFDNHVMIRVQDKHCHLLKLLLNIKKFLPHYLVLSPGLLCVGIVSSLAFCFAYVFVCFMSFSFNFLIPLDVKIYILFIVYLLLFLVVWVFSLLGCLLAAKLSSS